MTDLLLTGARARRLLPLPTLLLGAALGGCGIYDSGLLTGGGDAAEGPGGGDLTEGRGPEGGRAPDAALDGMPQGAADACPDDPEKDQPGRCGCGIPDMDSAMAAGCRGLVASLRHRYAFTGRGDAAVDTVGGRHGVLFNAALTGTGDLFLPGGDAGAYVELPAGLISVFDSATIELWATWQGGERKQPIFNLGHAAQPAPANVCNVDGVSYAGAYYHICPGPLSWPAARDSCRAAGGYLLAVADQAEQDFVASQLSPNTFYWFGGNDRDVEGTWFWATDVDSGMRFWQSPFAGRAGMNGYSAWAAGQPNNNGYGSGYGAGEDCGVMLGNGAWGDFGCAQRFAYICETGAQEGAMIVSSGLRLMAADETDLPRLSVVLAEDEVSLQGPAPLQVGAVVHVAVVFDGDQRMTRFYLNGEREGSVVAGAGLSELEDVNNWVGRSLIEGEPGFFGTLHELRVYGEALSLEAIVTSFRAGPDPPFLDP